MLIERAEREPDALALDDLTRTRTVAELVDRATRLGRWWTGELGLGPGDHVATVLGNRVEAVEVALAGVLSGIWFTPVNWHLTAEEIAYVVGDSGAGVVITDPEHEAVTRAAVAELARPVPVLVAGPELDAVLDGADDGPFDLDGRAGGSMIYTSGTTGRPKGVRRTTSPTVGAQLETYAGSGRALGLDGSGAHLVTGPLYHAAPLGFAVMDLHAGASVVLMPRWDEGRCLDLLAEREVRATHLVPTMFVRLLRLADDVRSAFTPDHLELVLHGAAPISPAIKRAMIDWWGPVLVEYWGGSEGGVVTVVGSDDWLAHPGTVGRAVPGHEVFAGDDDGSPLPAGETGVLWCRNLRQAQVFEYHGAPDKTAAAHRADGTYTLGDVGRVDDEGWVHLSDRVAHMIISGGVNIYPAEIEAVLIEHPSVGDVAVLGVPDAEWGEQVKAVVEPAAGVQPGDALTDELLALCRERLAGYKVPRSIDYDGQLPRHPTGKLYVRQLKDRYWAGHERRI